MAAHTEETKCVQGAVNNNTSDLKVTCKQWKRAEEISGG